MPLTEGAHAISLHRDGKEEYLPGFVEDKDEFELSKKLLFSYIKSPIISKRKTKQHFDVSSNDAHKGTSFGMKSHAAAIRPCHTLDNA
eukprot:15353891-Ditylum_brightwellii.AAC.1